MSLQPLGIASTETSPAGSSSDQLLRFIGPDQPLAVSGLVTEPTEKAFSGFRSCGDSMQPWVNQLFLSTFSIAMLVYPLVICYIAMEAMEAMEAMAHRNR